MLSRRLKLSNWYECEVHRWTFQELDAEDVCPVCLGERNERARIIALLESEDIIIDIVSAIRESTDDS